MMARHALNERNGNQLNSVTSNPLLSDCVHTGGRHVPVYEINLVNFVAERAHQIHQRRLFPIFSGFVVLFLHFQFFG